MTYHASLHWASRELSSGEKQVKVSYKNKNTSNKKEENVCASQDNEYSN